MAIYTTYFISDEDSLSELFPNWQVPRAEPVEVERVNPFTGKKSRVKSWEPENRAPQLRRAPSPEPENRAPEPQRAANLEPAPVGWLSRAKAWWTGSGTGPNRSAFTVRAINTSYEQYLNGRVLGEIKSLPHFACKGIDSPLLFALYEQLGCAPCEFDEFMARPARIPEDDESALLNSVPRELTQKLAALDDVSAAARLWLGAEEWEHTELAYVQEVLDQLCRLASEARNPPKELYLLIEF